MSNIAIKAENVSKYYRLGQINNGTLYADIQSWFARKFGKEDPHAKIGFNSAQSDKDGFWALKDINFEIKQGDRVGIIGRNGAGKSTLLKVISEITTPTTGNIYIKGRVASLLEVGTGFHPEMTGRENIYMNGAILGMKRAEITRQLDEIIDFAEIEKYIDTPVKRYSSGMYVRLAFAVAAHLQSEILIADEVLAVGDAAFQKKAIGKMSDLSTGEGRTVLFVSHNMGQIKALCNKGLLLKSGQLITQGDIFEVEKNYLYKSSSIDLQDLMSVKDTSIKRGFGSIHFKTASFNKSCYTMHEEIIFNATVFVDSETLGLYFKLLFKNDLGNYITGAMYCFSEGKIAAKSNYSVKIIIPERTLNKGDYHIYLWLGDRDALLQGNPTNYEVLEDLIPPIHIEESESDVGTHIGYFDIKYFASGKYLNCEEL